MSSKMKDIKDMLKRSTGYNKNKNSVEEDARCAGGVDLHDPVPYINVLDTDLFTSDYGYWFAKAMFQYSLAMVIEKEHRGRACINPKDVLAAVEHSYWTDPNRNDDDGNTRYPRVEIFNRIDSARLTKNEEAFQTVMHELSDKVKRHCQGLREGAVAELPAQPQETLDITHRTDSHESATSADSPLEKSSVTSDSDENTSRSSQDEAEHTRTIPHPQSPTVLETSEAELPLHKYVSILWEFAAKSGKKPSFKEGGIPDAWIYEASFDGYCRRATAQTKKKAHHLAAKLLCQALQIPLGLATV